MDVERIVNSYELGRVLDAMREELYLRPKNLWPVVLRRAAVENLVATPTDRRLGVWSDIRFIEKHQALRDAIVAAGGEAQPLRSAVDHVAALLERVEVYERD